MGWEGRNAIPAQILDGPEVKTSVPSVAPADCVRVRRTVRIQAAQVVPPFRFFVTSWLPDS